VKQSRMQLGIELFKRFLPLNMAEKWKVPVQNVPSPQNSGCISEHCTRVASFPGLIRRAWEWG